MSMNGYECKIVFDTLATTMPYLAIFQCTSQKVMVPFAQTLR